MVATEFEDHRSLLTQLIQRLEEKELPFYAKEANWNYYAWYITATIAFLSSVFSAMIAGLIDITQYGAYGRCLLIIVPIVGTAASGLLFLFRFREKEALRENGRIDVEDIIANAKSMAVKATNDEEYRKAFHEVRERFNALEKHQHNSDVALRSDEIKKIN